MSTRQSGDAKRRTVLLATIGHKANASEAQHQHCPRGSFGNRCHGNVKATIKRVVHERGNLAACSESNRNAHTNTNRAQEKPAGDNPM